MCCPSIEDIKSTIRKVAREDSWYQEHVESIKFDIIVREEMRDVQVVWGYNSPNVTDVVEMIIGLDKFRRYVGKLLEDYYTVGYIASPPSCFIGLVISSKENSSSLAEENRMLKNRIEELKAEKDEFEGAINERIQELEEEKDALRIQWGETRRALKGVLFNFSKARRLHEQGLNEYHENVQRLKKIVNGEVEEEEKEALYCNRCEEPMPIDLTRNGMCETCLFEMLPEAEDEDEEADDEHR